MSLRGFNKCSKPFNFHSQTNAVSILCLTGFSRGFSIRWFAKPGVKARFHSYLGRAAILAEVGTRAAILFPLKECFLKCQGSVDQNVLFWLHVTQKKGTGSQVTSLSYSGDTETQAYLSHPSVGSMPTAYMYT